MEVLDGIQQADGKTHRATVGNKRRRIHGYLRSHLDVWEQRSSCKAEGQRSFKCCGLQPVGRCVTNVNSDMAAVLSITPCSDWMRLRLFQVKAVTKVCLSF